MPKILINEKDFTSPGTPDGYSNFAVLVAGLKGTPANDANVEPDSNGIYEFTSAESFEKTIGLVAPKQEVDAIGADNKTRKTTFYHYGNQVAYELLNMGYSVIYLPINKTTVASLGNADTWEIFKDKSSYDFRFITHGLLESSSITDADKLALASAIERLEKVEFAENELVKINDAVQLAKQNAGDSAFDEAAALEAAYEELLDSFSADEATYAGFKGQEGFYELYTDAKTGITAEKASLEDTIEKLEAGGITTNIINKANRCIANLAKYSVDDVKTSKDIPGRGDCIALIEVDEKAYSGVASKPENAIIEAINEMSSMIDAANGKYCAMTVPSVFYKMNVDPKTDPFGGNKKFPGAFHYLACFMNSLKLGFAEWYAAAGYTRGVSSFVVENTTVKLGEIAINALEPRYYEDPKSSYPSFACNVIANFRGSYYLWGNRTAHPLGKKGNLTNGDLVASSFLNIRQLCSTIKKQLYVACRSFTFDPNSDTLWVNFKNAITPTLEAMKADQGIRDYKVLKVYTDKKATLKAKIRIIPIEAVEDFDLEVSLEDSFGETAVTTGDIQ